MKTFVIDVGRNFIKSASVQEGEIIQQFEPVKSPQTLADFKQGLDDVFKHFMDDCKAIAISHAGIVDDSSGRVVFNGSLPFLKGFSILPLCLKRKFSSRWKSDPVNLRVKRT